MKTKNYNLMAFALIALFAAIRLVYVAYGPFDLSPDEAHYWEWSRRLDLSYYSKGPGVAYVIAFFTSIFGDTTFGVRVGAVFFSAAASTLLYLLTLDIFKDSKTALYSVVLANIVPIFAAGSVLMTTDVLFIFFWAAAVYCAQAALSGRDSRWWYLTGAAVGLGFLGKYTMVLFYPCLLLFFAFSKPERPWLKRREPYLAAVISLALATPVIFWNISHGLVTIFHTMGQVHVGAAAQNEPGGAARALSQLLDFLGSQVLLITPLVFAAGAYGLWQCFTTSRRQGRALPLLVFFTSAPLFIFFTLASLNGKVQGNWAVASYVGAFAAAPWAFAQLYERSGAKKLLKTLAVVALVICAAGSVLAYEPVILEAMGARRILYGPPFNRVTAWKELGAEVSRIRSEMSAVGKVFIMSDTYQISSELAFYTDGNPVTYNAYTGQRRMNQYDLWPGYGGLKGYNAVYVKGGVAEAETEVTGRFASCEREIFTINHNGRVLKEFSIFRCLGFKGTDDSREIDRF
ncbi:MAG: glycosyltransferase family 39 protein [Deltaproteobacteria bacterium]|nr:glycosyltransferase family 39 protein [Deltaproteobacteria bacterium]